MYAIETFYEAMRKAPLTMLPKFLEIPFEDIMPKISRSLSSNLVKDVFVIKDPRLLVIAIHLYWDYILGRITAVYQSNLSKRDRQSFFLKLQYFFNCR